MGIEKRGILAYEFGKREKLLSHIERCKGASAVEAVSIRGWPRNGLAQIRQRLIKLNATNSIIRLVAFFWSNFVTRCLMFFESVWNVSATVWLEKMIKI